MFLSFLLPDNPHLQTFLQEYLHKRLTSTATGEKSIIERCIKRLKQGLSKKITRQISLLKPSIKEIEHSIFCINNNSLFDNTLEKIMIQQKSKGFDGSVPWIVEELCDEILAKNALKTEGIFRINGDHEQMTLLKIHLDNYDPISSLDAKTLSKLECLAFAGVLKLFFRELVEPLLPSKFYFDACAEDYDVNKITEKLKDYPDHYETLLYLIKFIRKFCRPEVVEKTKMTAANLAMVWAPNIIRCPSNDPAKILEFTVKEMRFIRDLIENWTIN